MAMILVKAKEFWLNLKFLIFPPKYHGKLIAWWHVIKFANVVEKGFQLMEILFQIKNKWVWKLLL
jgi:hypothetical protein